MDVRVPDLDPAPDLNTFAASSIIPSGITQILSLSFPSQGCSHGLGMILPSELICTVLGNVSHLLHCLSTTLHIPLLHPMQPFEISESTISASSDLGNCLPLSPMLGEETQGVGLDEWTAITKAYKTHITRINRSQQGVIKSKRPIGRSNVAQMQESSSFNRDSVHPIKGNGASSHFNKALYLLQTNIIEFCIHIGLKPSQLFPSHCLLHNLYMIRLRCVSLLHNYANPNGNDYLTVKGEIALRQQLDRNELMGHLLSGVSTANPQQTLGALTMLYRSERARDLEE